MLPVVLPALVARSEALLRQELIRHLSTLTPAELLARCEHTIATRKDPITARVIGSLGTSDYRALP